jgi:AbiV family abortive infection protein
MKQPLTMPDSGQCLEGARLGFANARSLYVSSLHLRKRRQDREAVFLLATTVEEIAKAGMLHRAWLVRDEPELFRKVLAAWRAMTGGRGAHQRKYGAAILQGTNTMLLGLVVGIITDVLSRDRTKSAADEVAEMLLSGVPSAVPPWFDRLWTERQAIYVGWSGDEWSSQPGAGAAFYDEGREYVLRLFRNLRSDIQRSA